MKIGIDIGGSHMALGVVNRENEILIQKEHNWTSTEKRNLEENILQYCKTMIQEIQTQQQALKIEKIGIGYPSASIIDGVITKNGKKFYLAQILSEEFQVPVYLKNDVKCSANCEKTIGMLQDYSNCFFMTLGTGIGGAYFYQNEMVKPSVYQGFEIGHTIIEVNGRQCRCGRKGCLEEYASMRAFRSDIETLFGIEGLTSHKMFEIIANKQKEEEVNKIINQYLTYVAIGLGNVIRVFEPDAICIGGSFSYYAPIFMDRLTEKVQQDFQGRMIPPILIAKYNNEAGIIGASMLASN